MVLILHVIFASAWIGLVVGEAVIELMANDRETRKFVAKAHEIMDVYFEGPLVALTLVSGAHLLYGLWPDISVLLVIKIVCALIAVFVNVLCIRWVVLRARAETDSEFAEIAHKVNHTKYAIPFALVALGIGILGAYLKTPV